MKQVVYYKCALQVKAGMFKLFINSIFQSFDVPRTKGSLPEFESKLLRRCKFYNCVFKQKLMVAKSYISKTSSIL